MSAGRIILISGVPGSGKSTVARALCDRFTRALYLSGDDLRGNVVSGFASALDEWTPEHSRQFSLSWRALARTAALYADAGFAVVIDDVVRQEDLDRDFMTELGNRRIHRVLLRPSLAIALSRSSSRTGKDFDPSRLVPIIERLYPTFADSSDGWQVLDNSELSAEQTVDLILRSS